MDFMATVLILVLVEHTLRAANYSPTSTMARCLNPCFSGTYSQSVLWNGLKVVFVCLNPCFSGTYSQSSRVLDCERLGECLNPCFSGTYSQSRAHTSSWEPWQVLILVLVEHTLRVPVNKPFFVVGSVLILVLVEHTLRESIMCRAINNGVVLILVLVEHTLRVWMVQSWASGCWS